MKQGTISILMGVHSPFHAFLVLIAWIKLYHSFPKAWEIICIFLHDIGHLGLNYLDSYEEKKKHWVLGAKIAYLFFGQKGFMLVAGHDLNSGLPESKLMKADKSSWYYAPLWWHFWQCIVEPKIYLPDKMSNHIRYFRKKVRQNLDNGLYRSTHEIYLELQKRR